LNGIEQRYFLTTRAGKTGSRIGSRKATEQVAEMNFSLPWNFVY